MELLSERYGWKPDEIRLMDSRDVAVYLEITNMRRKLEDQAQEAARYGIDR